MIQTFENNEFKATVEYCGNDMHKVTYTGPGMKPFTNLVFNEDQDKGEKDSIEMAEKFVNSRGTNGKECLFYN